MKTDFTIKELEQRLMKNLKQHRKSGSQLNRQLTHENASSLDIRKCSQCQWRNDITIPCRCPTHHRQRMIPPLVGHRHRVSDSHMKGKVSRYHSQIDEQRLQKNTKFNDNLHDYLIEATKALKKYGSRPFRKGQRVFEANSHAQSGSTTQLLADAIDEGTLSRSIRKRQHDSQYFQMLSTLQQKYFKNKQKYEKQYAQSTNGYLINRKLLNKPNEQGVSKQQDNSTLTTKEPSQHNSPNRLIPKYLKPLDDNSYRFRQAIRYLLRRGYYLEENSSPEQLTELIQEIFKDMRQFEEINHKRILQAKNDKSKKKDSKEEKEQLLNSTNNIRQSKQSLKSNSVGGQKQQRLSIKLLDGYGKSVGSKFRSLYDVSMKNLLEDINEEELVELAHADCNDLIEGLEYIEKELSAELKSGTAPQYVMEKKASNFVSKVIKTVEGSIRLNQAEILNRSGFLQNGLKIINRYENEIISKATPLGQVEQIEQQLNEELKEAMVRQGQNPATVEQNTQKVQNNSQRSSIRNDAMRETSNIPRRSKFLKDPFKADQIKKIALSHLSKKKQIYKYKVKQDENRKSQIEKTITESSHETKKQEKERYTHKRKRALNKLVFQDDTTSGQQTSRPESPVKEESPQDSAFSSHFSTSRNLKSTKNIKSLTSYHQQQKTQAILKQINKALTACHLEIFKVEKQQSYIVKHQKICRLKQFIQLQPSIGSGQLFKGIKKYEQNQRSFFENNTYYGFFEHISDMNDQIVLKSIISVENQDDRLKWTDQIKTVTKEKKKIEFCDEDYEEYLREPQFSKIREREQLHQQVRRQVKEQIKEESLLEDDIIQSGLQCHRPFEDRLVRIPILKKNKVKTEKSRSPRKEQDIKYLLNEIRRRHPDFFNDLLQSNMIYFQHI